MKKIPLEWSRIQKINKIVDRSNPNTVIPLGDDSFVYKNFSGKSVWCQDLQVEGIHFKREYTSAADLGYKSLAVNISDIVAMGGTPHFAQVSLAIPKEISDEWIEDFYLSMAELADQCQCQIVGGDLTASPGPIFVDVSVMGSVENPIPRKGARPGDLLLCSGPLGSSAAGLIALTNSWPDFDFVKNQHRRPRPRWDLLKMLEEHSQHIHALMDCSDGLVVDSYKLIPFQGGLKIFAENLPLHPETPKVADRMGVSSEDLALWGGEDYQLLAAVSPEAYQHFQEWHLVGQFTDAAGVFLEKENSSVALEELRGFKHFGS